MADVEGKKLTELRVIDLKTELERRSLDKTGNKATLFERLSKAIIDEGHNPDEYLIVPFGGLPCKNSPRKNSGVQSLDDFMDISDNQQEDNMPAEGNIEVKLKVEEDLTNQETLISYKPEESQSDDYNVSENIKISKASVTQDPEVPNEVPDTSSNRPDISTCHQIVSIEASNQPHISETNGIDNEDSINLTIGEDEENLLVEETESHDKSKDGGGEKKLQENKKGDSKGSSKAESGVGGKEGMVSGANNVGIKNKQEGGDGSKSSESTNKNLKREEKERKSSHICPVNASSRNLWVSGLSSTTRATDLKQIFSKYGKVIGAKVVTNARTPGARCYGYVTMSTSEDAGKCIQHLHRTELHGRVISVEKAKGDTQQSHVRKRDTLNGKSEKKEENEKIKDDHETYDKKDKKIREETDEPKAIDPVIARKADEKPDLADNKKVDLSDKKEDPLKDSDTRSTKSISKKLENEKVKRDEKRVRSWNHRSDTRSRSRERRRRDDVLTFAKIREERERQRLRERERILREEERRRREDMERQREVERRQREEAVRLEREREKLRRERERIEQEKAELLRLERERQKLEREKLERERLELKRQQMRLEESRRAPLPPSIKRTSSDRRDPRDIYSEPERKRIATEHSRRHSPDRIAERRTEVIDRVSDRRIDSSPSSRYESGRTASDNGLKKEFKRSDFTSRSSRPESFTDVSRGREVILRREPHPASSSIDPRQVKERYERSSTAYARERDIRRSDSDAHRSSRDSHTRYSENFKPTSSSAQREGRYIENNRTSSGWHTGPPSTKTFNSMSGGGARDPRNDQSSWSSRSSDNVNRWNSSSSSMGSTLRHPVVSSTYQSGPIQALGLNAPGTTSSYDRFELYKTSIPSIRKY